VLLPRQQAKLARGADDKEHAMSQTPNTAIAVIGIDIGKNSFHVAGHDARGAIVLRQKWSRGQVETRLANIPPCLIGMEACVGAHHLSRKLASLGHDARLMPAKYVRPYPPPFSVTEANGSQVEFVPWRSQKEKALSSPLLVRMHPSGDRWPHNASDLALLS
jgi:hypothetical protein